MDNARITSKIRDTLHGIENSCVAFDDGDRFEAMRIAVSARLLFHTTKNSTSLLTLADRAELRLLNSSYPPDPYIDYVVILNSLCSVRSSGGRISLHAPLENAPMGGFLPWQQWWSQVVFVDGYHRATRSNIVLTAANKDGGAHLDDLPDWYEALQKGGTWLSRAGVHEQHLVMLRQVGYEILNSPELRAL
jgi:hypothetical protein